MTFHKRRLTAVSSIMKKMMVSSESKSENLVNLVDDEFCIQVADNQVDRAKAFELAKKVYLQKGFTDKMDEEYLVYDYDAQPSTVIFVVKTKEGRVVGTLTLAFKTKVSGLLPVEKIFSEEIKQLNTSGREFVEICRLAIDDEYRNSKKILLHLFNFVSIYNMYVRNPEYIFIEVNPHHANFYESFMSFKVFGGVKECPSVGKPAVLMYFPVDTLQDLIIEHKKNTDKRFRSLLKNFSDKPMEKLYLNYLNSVETSISIDEKIFFNLPIGVDDDVLEIVV